MIAITEAQASYIAGFIDGEGTINVLVTGQGKHLVELSIGQIDPRPLLFIQRLCGGTICTSKQKNRPTSKMIYHWSIRGEGFDAVIKKVSPYLILKKEKAEIAMAMRGRLSPKNKKIRVSDGERVIRLALVQRAKALSQ